MVSGLEILGYLPTQEAFLQLFLHDDASLVMTDVHSGKGKLLGAKRHTINIFRDCERLQKLLKI